MLTPDTDDEPLLCAVEKRPTARPPSLPPPPTAPTKKVGVSKGGSAAGSILGVGDSQGEEEEDVARSASSASFSRSAGPALVYFTLV